MSRLRITIYSLIALTVIVVGIFGFGYRKLHKSVEAVGGFPYQIGITKSIVNPCILAGYVCGATIPTPEAVAACNTRPVACLTYAYVEGTPAGGMPPYGVLLPYPIIAKIGLVPSAPLICGATSPVTAEAGVCASIAGAYSPTGGVASAIGKPFPGFAFLMKKAFDDVKFSIAGEKR